MKKILMAISFLLSSCAAAPLNMGHYVDDKPLRGTSYYNRDHVRPFWQCVFNNMNIDCKE